LQEKTIFNYISKWLDINEKMANRKLISNTKTLELKNLVKFLHRTKYTFVVAGSCQQPHMYVKPEAEITVFKLLMMSGVSLETC